MSEEQKDTNGDTSKTEEMKQQDEPKQETETMKEDAKNEGKTNEHDSNNARGDDGGGGDDEADESESDSEEELPPGLLEKPIEILQDKRERKKVTRFVPDDNHTLATDKKKLEIKEGSGVKLSEHPRVEWYLQRNRAEDLKIVHKLFFGVFGDIYTCKKNIRNFTGFAFSKDSSEYQKKEDYLGKFTLDNLKWALTICDVEKKKGLKEDLINALLEWCLCPKPSGKPLPEKKAKKQLKVLKKRKRKAKTSKAKSKEAVNNSTVASDLSSDSEDDKPKAKVPKVKSPKRKPASANATKKKPQQAAKRKSGPAAGLPKKMAKIKIKSPKKVGDADDSDDSDAPLQKKKTFPTNAQIYAAVEKILKGANLEEITMRNVCLQVYKLYPEFDLSERKPFIKESVKKIIS